MFAHDRLELPANLLPDDVSDLLARLGYRVDREEVVPVGIVTHMSKRL